MGRGVQEAYDLFKSNKKKLQQIENEMKILEAQVDQCTQSKKYKFEEKRQKEGMVSIKHYFWHLT